MTHIIKFIRKLIQSLHHHHWNTTHLNPYMMPDPNRQFCKCGVFREVRTYEGLSKWRWEYSDGDSGKWRRTGNIDDTLAEIKESG